MKLNTMFTKILAGAILAIPVAMGAVVDPKDDAQLAFENKIRRELIMLPFYSIFDNLTFRVDGGNVTLTGQVSRPSLKGDAERVVRRIAGVNFVANSIEVLPLSPHDNRIRIAATRAIYGHSVLNRYAAGAVPSIHIIVKNGNVTLEGVVANEMDRNIANIQANSVFGVFSVTNNLRLENRRS
jgi:hyperosmotically inducible protein